jgi:NAD-dependent dihydropyrimidine dehydrogenase PreA subunit
MPGAPPPSRDPEKAKRAARDPARPGEACEAAPLAWRPVVDRARCEGKADCVAVCPYQVFEVGRLSDGDYRALGLVGRLKARVHGMKTALTPRADACRACGLCVVACPEDALTLVRAG